MNGAKAASTSVNPLALAPSLRKPKTGLPGFGSTSCYPSQTDPKVAKHARSTGKQTSGSPPKADPNSVAPDGYPHHPELGHGAVVSGATSKQSKRPFCMGESSEKVS
eukprot:TRINITY_DN32581_c0_g1_i1.p2 TRINITY_DN32581_c0_g1~~TRINITY_DN32581_c0_g1_i1.p2  ORF type:complete len:107 (+),score=18.34 TRINITY_DN32581_c0_g1_i1:185-505(+)